MPRTSSLRRRLCRKSSIEEDFFFFFRSQNPRGIEVEIVVTDSNRNGFDLRVLLLGSKRCQAGLNPTGMVDGNSLYMIGNSNEAVVHGIGYMRIQASNGFNPTAAAFNKQGDLTYIGNSKGEILIVDSKSIQVVALTPASGVVNLTENPNL